jgi:hypothetical protein
MREQPDDLTVVGRLIPGADGWTDVTPADVPPSWLSLLDLDARSLDTEASELLAGLAPDGGPVDVVASSPVGDVVVQSLVGDVITQSLDGLRASGVYADAPDIVIDVTLSDLVTEPFGGEALGDDVLGELAATALDSLVVADAGSAGIVDPFFDSIDVDSIDPPQSGVHEPGARDGVLDDRERDDAVGDPAGEPLVDDLADDIVGAVAAPLRVVSHDPFDAIEPASVEPDSTPDTPGHDLLAEHDAAPLVDPIDLTDPLVDAPTDDGGSRIDDVFDGLDHFGPDG